MPIGSRRVVLNVQGIRDNSCRERVTEVLGRVNGVKEVTVSLIRSRAVVVYVPPCDPPELLRAVERAGCTATWDDAAPDQ